MAIDFGKLTQGSSSDTVLHPREIFHMLPEKEGKYQYPRDVQTEVWNQWYARRQSRDNVLKMNTGAGKTVVGLLILKSCLNETKGPAVYVAPDPYLVQQVIKEGHSLGIEMTDDPRSPRYRKGKAILVINIYKLINGLSVFGVGDTGIKIDIGSIIIDDAHACLATTEDQFTLITPKYSQCYQEIFQLVKPELAKQSETKTIDIEYQANGEFMQIPFWWWQKNIKDISRIIHSCKEFDDEIKFTWPLIKDSLRLCRGVIGEGKVEVSPRCMPIKEIPSLANAERRIFMTATLAEDSILLTHFEAEPKSIESPITPVNADDIGERMILIPQELNPSINDIEIKALLNELSDQYNTVVIVPSGYRAEFWQDVADLTLRADDLKTGVEKLKEGHVGLVVVINKYDGIDLPHDACRILVIDGLPDIRRMIDKIEQAILSGSSELLSMLIQRVEQGMGRGIRSNDDYCAVFLMGRSLTDQMYHKDALAKLTPATKAQYLLSEQLGEQIRGKGSDEIKEVVDYLLGRNTEWIKASKSALAGLKSETNCTVNEVATNQREAFNSASIGDYNHAIILMQELVNKATDKKVRGWLKQQLAEYINFVNPVESQEILKSAVKENNQIIHPVDGITYSKLHSSVDSQVNLCSKYLLTNFSNPNEFLIYINGILEDFVFRTDCSSRFERAVKHIARIIGFNSQRPEAEYGKGPDVLWETGNLEYFVIECKNGAITHYIKKHDCDQLSGSMNWFKLNYDTSCKAIPILIHPTNLFEKHGSPHGKTRVITKKKLDKLKVALNDFSIAITNNSGEFDDIKNLEKFLNHFALMPDKFISRYTEKYKLES